MNESRWAKRFLILAAVFFLLFLLLGWLITPPSRVIEWDENASNSAFSWCFAQPKIFAFVEDWSNLGTSPFLYYLGAIPIIFLLWKREMFLAVLFFAFEVATRRLQSDLKLQFTRNRPFREEFQQLPDYTFPSGHALATTTIIAMSLFLVAVYCKPIKQRVLIFAVGILFVVSICASRVLLGAHHVLDVCGGAAFGLAWAFLGCAVCEWRRPKLIPPPKWNPVTDAPTLPRVDS